jgi:hypothetical protein
VLLFFKVNSHYSKCAWLLQQKREPTAGYNLQNLQAGMNPEITCNALEQIKTRDS